MKSKTVILGIITIAHGIAPVLADWDVSTIDWTQVEVGLGMIFLRFGVQKAQNAATATK